MIQCTWIFLCMHSSYAGLTIVLLLSAAFVFEHDRFQLILLYVARGGVDIFLCRLSSFFWRK
jgi:hypothetical protein